MNISQLLCSPVPSKASPSTAYAPPAGPHPDPEDSPRSSQGSPTPSAPDTPFKVINRCGNCRQRGHNRKTCPKPEAPKPPPVVTRPRARGCCGLCGEPGHNRTSCAMAPPK